MLRDRCQGVDPERLPKRQENEHHKILKLSQRKFMKTGGLEAKKLLAELQSLYGEKT